MGYYSTWPFLCELGLLVAFAATPLFRHADMAQNGDGSRVETLDGLRGFLALGVFFHHTAIYHEYLRSGRWESPPSRIYSLLGQLAISLFFMITGYLFWRHVLKVNGRPNWRALYIGRFSRILPQYWFAVLLVLFGVGVHTGWHLDVSLGKLLIQILEWTAGGVFNLVPINGYSNTSELIASVTWTLRYEWLFYASLIFTAFIARRRTIGLLFPPVALAASLFYFGELASTSFGPKHPIRLSLFFVGMSVASFRAARPNFRARGILASITTVLLLVYIFSGFANVDAVLPILLLGVAFLLIASGSTAFGLLTSRPAKRLGNISYGIYLLQGPVIAAVFANQSVRQFALLSPLNHWSVVMADGMILVSFATLTHVFIERRGVDLGRRLAASRATGSPVGAMA